ncbi:MAG: tetratricopeptide repeat protein [Acidobacteriota bacterium]
MAKSGIFTTLLCLIMVSASLVFAQNQSISTDINSSTAISMDQTGQRYKTLINEILQISQAYYYQGRLDDALRLLDNSNEMLDQEEVTCEDWTRVLIQRAKITSFKGSLSGNKDYHNLSLTLLAEAKRRAEDSHDKQLLADTLDLIGFILYIKDFSQADTETLLGYYQKALAIRKEIDDQRGISDSLFHIGLVYENRANASKDDKQKAFEYYQQALAIAKQGDYKLEKSYAFRHLGYFYQENGELDKALSYYQQSLSLREEIGFKPYLSPAHLLIGDFYFDTR